MGRMARRAASSGVDTSQTVDHITITPSLSTLTIGTPTQLTATCYNAAGQVIQRSVTWQSSAKTLASVTAAGLVTAMFLGSVTITASVPSDGKSASMTMATSGTPWDGSDSDVIATIGNSSVVGDWNPDLPSTVTLSSGQLSQLDDRRGTGAGPSLFGKAATGDAIHLPNFNPTTSVISTDTSGPTSLYSALAGDSRFNLGSGDLTIAWIGAVSSVGQGTACHGLQGVSDVDHINATLIGNFDPTKTLDLLLNTTASTGYQIGCKLAIRTQLRLYIETFTQPIGTSGQVNGAALTSIEQIGRFRKTLVPATDNVYTKYASQNFRIFWGGALASNGSMGNVTVFFRRGWAFNRKLTRTDIAALERWCVAHGVTTATETTHGIAMVSDSRFVVGAVDMNHDPVPTRVQAYLGDQYDVSNRYIAGDDLAKLTTTSMTDRLARDGDASRSYDWGGGFYNVNGFNLGHTAEQARDYVITAAAAAHADNKRFFWCTETNQTGGIPQAAQYNTYLRQLRDAGTIEVLIELDRDSALVDTTDTTIFVGAPSTSLHYLPKGQDRIALHIAQGIAAYDGTTVNLAA